MSSIICWLITFALGAFLFYLLQNQDGAYSETPYMIGIVVVMACLSVVLWNWSNYLTLTGALYRGAIMSVVIVGYFAFMPVVTVSNMLFMSMNSGNIFTFKTDDSFSVLERSALYHSLETTYHRHIAYVIVLIVLSIILIVVGKKVNFKTVKKKGI